MNQVPTDKNRLKLISGQLRRQMTPSSRNQNRGSGEADGVSMAIAAFAQHPCQWRVATSLCRYHSKPRLSSKANKKLLQWAVGGQTAGSIPGQPLGAEPEAATSFTH